MEFQEKKILVVDDDPDMREVITMILDVEGYQIAELDNGNEVIAAIEAFHPDLVLLDVMLGDVDGRDICKAIKNSPSMSHIPVIIISATHGLHTRSEKNCGAEHYISKPFEVEHLVEKVRSYLN